MAMHRTNIIRRMDDLGRVVIPKNIRDTLGFKEGDPFEIYTDKDGMVGFKKLNQKKDLAEKCREFVEQHRSCIRSVIILDTKTTVILTGGAEGMSTWHSADKFDYNVAVTYALKDTGLFPDCPV